MSVKNNATVVRVDWETKDGKHEFNIFDEDKVEEKVKELNEEGAATEIRFSQTFTYYNVSDTTPTDDLLELVSSLTEQANIINRALDIKQNQFVRGLMKQDNFTPVEGTYDLADIAAREAERKSASPETKAARALSKLAGYEITPEALASILAAMNPSQAQGA
jgi:hypothetical protein